MVKCDNQKNFCSHHQDPKSISGDSSYPLIVIWIPFIKICKVL